jgi:hypothetical protein
MARRVMNGKLNGWISGQVYIIYIERKILCGCVSRRLESQTFGCLDEIAKLMDKLTTGLTTGVPSPTEAENFSSSSCVQTSCEAHPASYPVGLPAV